MPPLKNFPGSSAHSFVHLREAVREAQLENRLDVGVGPADIISRIPIAQKLLTCRSLHVSGGVQPSRQLAVQRCTRSQHQYESSLPCCAKPRERSKNNLENRGREWEEMAGGGLKCIRTLLYPRFTRSLLALGPVMP